MIKGSYHRNCDSFLFCSLFYEKISLYPPIRIALFTECQCSSIITNNIKHEHEAKRYGDDMAGKDQNYNKEECWKKIKEQVSSLKYGNVIITVHDGKITQVETSTKIRF